MPEPVTVVVPAWNGERWLPGLFASLAAQTQQPAEVVVVDNGSTDATLAWLAREAPQARGRRRGVGHARRGLRRVGRGGAVPALGRPRRGRVRRALLQLSGGRRPGAALATRRLEVRLRAARGRPACGRRLVGRALEAGRL